MSLYEDEMSAMDFDFTSTLTKLLGISEDEVSDLIEKLDVDDLTDLVDACVKGNADEARKIIGSETEELEPAADKDEGEEEKSDEPEIGDLIAPKEKLRAQRNKKKARILRKSETELGEDTAPDVIFNIGDPVAVDGEEATVKVPSGPGDTVGVLINGELKMVNKNSVHPITEGVLGMTPMPGLKPSGDLQRIRELAGLPSDYETDSMDQPPMTPPLEAGEPEVGLPDAMADEPAMDEPAMDGGMDDGMDGMGDVADVHHSTGMEPDVDAGMEPPAPMGGPDMAALPAPEAEPALPGSLEDAAALDAAITNIEDMIPNVKISEYKTLVARLEALVAMAKSAGKTALAESSLKVKPEMKAKIAAFAAGRKPKTEDKIAPKPEFSKPAPLAKIDGPKPQSAPKVADAGVGENTRKTLMDYVREADGDGSETLGANRIEAMKNLQTRMGPGTTPQAASAAFDAMMKDGGVKQMGSAFTMAPMSDDNLKTNVAAMKKPTQTPTQSDASTTDTTTSTGSTTTNPGANVQGAPNSSYQGG
jgi:hypothetical protein